MKNRERRIFIKKAGIVTSVIMSQPFLSCVQSSHRATSYTGKKLGVALVGLGYYSTDLLAPALEITKYCDLKGIVTGSPEKVDIWQERYGISKGNIYNYDNMDLIANNDEIDVIYIVVPTGLHMKYAIKAAETGKHVWCEKPMALDVSQCQAIIDACSKNKVKLSIGYRVQHDPNMQEIMSLTSTRKFGKVQAMYAGAGYAGGVGTGWRFQKALGGGALYDMGVYTINALRHAGRIEPIAVVSASHSTKRPDAFKEVDETTEYVLEFEGGVFGSGKTSVGEQYNILQISCEKGSYMLSPMQAYNGLKGERTDGVKIYTEVANQQALQMDNDALAILNNQDVLVPGIDGLRDIRIVNAIQKSAKIGKRVEVPS